MGWETLAMAGFQALQATNQMNQGTAAAKATVAEGANQAQNAANDTARATGKLRSSFLSSGLTLEGGPMAAISQAFDVGNTNISRIVSNANTTAKNQINTARSQALATLASAASSAATPTFMSSIEKGVDSLGQDIGSIFDSSPTGPYLSPFTSQFYGRQPVGQAVDLGKYNGRFTN